MNFSIIQDLVRSLPGDRREAIVELKNRILERRENFTSKDAMYSVKTIETLMRKPEINITFANRSDGESWTSQLDYLLGKIEAFEENFVGEIIEENIDKFIDETISEDETQLSAEDKLSIHSKLSDVRQKIEKSGLPNKKKNLLFNKINALAMEVDRYGTNLESFFGFIVDLSFSAKKFHENLKPAIDDIQDALRTIYVRKAKNDGIELPKPEDLPQLPAPREFE